ncbi:MAG TPA: saccharopine dehydrogenase C-terminal domain-containing protein [bacterium]
MNICVLGGGMQGRVAAFDLARSGHLVTVLDIDRSNLRRLRGTPLIKTVRFDAGDRRSLVTFIKKHRYDAVLGALPAALGFGAMQCAIEARCDMVDMSYLTEDPFLLNTKARKQGVRIIPDAGFAPGLSNLIVGRAASEIKKIDRLRILVGGIPQDPRPPFNYRITWSPADLIEEYLRPARIVHDHRKVVILALTGIEEFTVRGIGRLECFYTDGLRTLLKTLKSIRHMEEKTIRYPGHAALFKTLIAGGFLGTKPLKNGPCGFRPKDLTVQVLRDVLSQGSERDISILIIEIRSDRARRRYMCVDRYDRRRHMTSMTRMTAFSGSLFTQCFKQYPGCGVIPPEQLGQVAPIFEFIITRLARRGIRIARS